MSPVENAAMQVVLLLVGLGIVRIVWMRVSRKARRAKAAEGDAPVVVPRGRSARGPILLVWGGDAAGFGERLRDALEDEGVRNVVALAGDALARPDIGSGSALVTVVDGSWLRWGHDDRSDRHRDALEAALAADVRVVPVIPDGARMPTEVELPPALKRLARLNGHEVHEDSWSHSVHRLADGLRS